MPAGNDAKNAASELADQFGEGVGRADELIQASRERYAGGLAEAQLAAIDPEATEELDVAKVAKPAGVKKDDIVDAAVRGNYVTFVYTDDSGRTHKGAVRREALGKSPKSAEKAEEKAEEEQQPGTQREGESSEKSQGKKTDGE